MNIFIHIRNNHNQWGGDLTVIKGLELGLKQLGTDVLLSDNLEASLGFKYIFLTNTCIDKRTEAAYLTHHGRAYAMLTFHEDFLHYFTSSIGFVKCAEAILKQESMGGIAMSVQSLSANPSLCAYFGPAAIRNGILNAQVLEQALVCLPSSKFEERTIRRDAPKARTKVWLAPTGLVHEWQSSQSAGFTDLCKLEAPYILQVGRMETRKNQLATVLASADIPAELVFVCTKGYQPWYEKLVVDAILKHRKYPTVIVSENLPSQQHGHLRIVQMPEGKKLSTQLLQSAYLGAAVNAHPAFYELPGLTYLESIHCKVQTICSTWTSVSEYLQGDTPGSGVYYVDPRSILSLKQAIIESIYSAQSVTATTVKVSPVEYARQIVGSLLNHS
jgi:glycosyltransferase involved in cell wall biosynthesis